MNVQKKTQIINFIDALAVMDIQTLSNFGNDQEMSITLG